MRSETAAAASSGQAARSAKTAAADVAAVIENALPGIGKPLSEKGKKEETIREEEGRERRGAAADSDALSAKFAQLSRLTSIDRRGSAVDPFAKMCG